MRDAREYRPKHRSPRKFLATRLSLLVAGVTLVAVSSWSA
jgi:hypothetical protein